MDYSKYDCRDRVISQNFTAKLIRIKAAQLCRRSDFSVSDYDDLRQEMVVYLIEKSHLFDPDRGNVESFVTTVVNTSVAKSLRFRSRQKRAGDLTAVSLERTEIRGRHGTCALRDAMSTWDGGRRTGTVRLEYGPESVDRADALEYAMSRLALDDRELLQHVADHGWSSASRVWTELMGRPICRRSIERRLRALRSVFEDAGFGCK